MRYVGNDPVISGVKKANTKYYFNLDSVMYLFSSVLIFGAFVIGAWNLAPFIPRVSNPKDFMVLSMKTVALLLGAFYPVFVYSRKNKVNNVVREGEEELEKVTEDLKQNGVLVTVSLLKSGFVLSDVPVKRYDFGTDTMEVSELKKLHFVDVHGKYYVLQEEISNLKNLKNELLLAEKSYVYLLDEADYSSEDNYVKRLYYK